MSAKLVNPHKIRAFIAKENPELKVTPGFLAFLDLHMESVLKRASVVKGITFLDAPAALTACRYPFVVGTMDMEYRP